MTKRHDAKPMLDNMAATVPALDDLKRRVERNAIEAVCTPGECIRVANGDADETRREGLRAMVAMDEELDREHPGFMTGDGE